MSLTDEELHQVVEHFAKLHGVSTREAVAEVMEDMPDVDDEDGPAEDETPADEAQPKPRGWAHWTAGATALVVMGLLVGGAIIALMRFLNGPAEANIAQAKSELVSTTPTPDASIAQLVGQTFTLNYPHVFDQVANDKPDSGSIEEFRLSSKTNYRRLIAVDVRRELITALSDDASYRIRQQHPETYKESVRKTANGTVNVMVKNDSHEETLFWLHNGELLMISVTSTDANDNVEAFMKVVSDSVRWTS